MKTRRYINEETPFHGSNRGSNPRGDANTKSLKKKHSLNDSLDLDLQYINTANHEDARRITVKLAAICEKLVNTSRRKRSA